LAPESLTRENHFVVIISRERTKNKEALKGVEEKYETETLWSKGEGTITSTNKEKSFFSCDKKRKVNRVSSHNSQLTIVTD